MSQKTLPAMPRAKGPIRRAVRIEARNGDQIICKTKSFTQAQGVEYHPTIDATTFESHCDCPASVYRPHEVCKHRIKAALNLIRRGELGAAWLQRAGKTLCHRCGAAEDIHPMCYNDGSLMHDAWICFPCIQGLRAEKKGLTAARSELEVRADKEIEPFADEMSDAEIDFEMRRAYHQNRVNNGEYVHAGDWAHYGLTEGDNA